MRQTGVGISIGKPLIHSLSGDMPDASAVKCDIAYQCSKKGTCKLVGIGVEVPDVCYYKFELMPKVDVYNFYCNDYIEGPCPWCGGSGVMMKENNGAEFPVPCVC